MGWLFTLGQSRAQLIQRLTRDEDNERSSYHTLNWCTKGNVLWTVQEVTYKLSLQYEVGVPNRFIGCFLMKNDRGHGWGYKDMCESMFPYYFTCPLAYLDAVPEANAGWRAKVREYHALRSRKAKVGDIWSLVPGYTVRQVEIVSIRPLLGRGRPDGRIYRIKRELLGEKLSLAEDSPPEPLPIRAATTSEPGVAHDHPG